MKVRSHILGASVAAMCAAVFVATAHPAQAGVNVWTSLGPPGGHVLALAIDPIAPRTLYAGTHATYPGHFAGGVYKSTDAGATWSGAGLTLSLVYALAIDPNTPTTLYTATGYLYKSTDAGATWSDTGLTTSVSTLAIDPCTPTTLYAGGDGVFKSTDAGTTWNDTGLTTRVSTLAIDPRTPTTLYAGGDGVFKSTDGGSTWNALNTGLTHTLVSALAIDPMEPRWVYAATEGAGVFAIEQLSACVGDCSSTRTVAINDVVTLVNILLGTAPSSACLNGLPVGGDVTIALIIAAVNSALHGCGG
jgi:photosystem II stability/assembly factor-like uncharacterized protein